MAKLHICPCLSVELHQGSQWNLFFFLLEFIEIMTRGRPAFTQMSCNNWRWHWVIPAFVSHSFSSPARVVGIFSAVCFYPQFWVPTLLLVRLLTQTCLNRRWLIFTCWVFRSRSRTNEKFYIPLRWVKPTYAVRNGLGLFSKWRYSTLSDS